MSARVREPGERPTRCASAGLASEHDHPAASAAAAGPVTVADGPRPAAHAGSLPGAGPLGPDRAAPRAGARAALTGGALPEPRSGHDALR
jgi:hypothetical protein